MSGLPKLSATITVLRSDAATIHSFMAPPEGEMTCSQVIETEHQVVVVDAQLLRSCAQDLRSYVDRLGKRIDRVLISHAHGDHWLGLEFFQDVPIYALPGVQNELAAMGDGFRQYKKGQLGDQISDVTVLPAHTLAEGTEVIDGLTYVFKRIVNAESPEALLIELPELKTLIAQDLVYNGIYPCVGIKGADGGYLFDGWVRQLQTLQAGDYATVLAGHGEPTTAAVFPELVEYIQFAKQTFESNVGPEGMKAAMMEKYPAYRYPEMLDASNILLYFWKW